jgi:hypothetical protein
MEAIRKSIYISGTADEKIKGLASQLDWSDSKVVEYLIINSNLTAKEVLERALKEHNGQ